jgi:hypothetical protein
MHVQMPQKQVHMLQFLDSLLKPSKSFIRALRAEGKTLRVLTKKREADFVKNKTHSNSCITPTE